MRRRAGAAGKSRRPDVGQASIELVGLVPVVLIVVVLVLQLLAMVYTAHAASQAARDAARAYSLDESPQAAAAASLPGGVSLVSVTTFGPNHGVRVAVHAPPVLVIGDGQISRAVTMP